MTAPHPLRRWLPLVVAGLTACLSRGPSKSALPEFEQESTAEDGEARLRGECDVGNVNACWELGFSADEAGDPETAATYYRKACEADPDNGCLVATDDTARAARVFEALTWVCEDRNAPKECLALAVALDEGRGASIDLPRARAAATKSCEGGYALGCAQQGFYEVNGLGGAEDREQGARTVARACELAEGICGWSEFLAGTGPAGVFGQFVGDPKKGIVVRVNRSAAITKGDEVSLWVSAHGGQRVEAWYKTVNGVVTAYEDGPAHILDTSNTVMRVNMVPRAYVVVTTPATEAVRAAPKPLTEEQLRPWSQGKLELDAVEKTIAGHASEIDLCFQGASPQDLGARAVIAFTVDHRGTVIASRGVADEFHDEDIATCIRTTLEEWTFPAPTSGIAVVRYVFSRSK